MKQDNTFDVITIVLFIGTILFFSIFFMFPAFLGFQIDNNIEELPEGIVFRQFSDAVYRNKEQNDFIKLYNYKLFSVIDNYNVIIGDNNFLFETVSEDGEYNYLLDYLGQSKLSSSQLDIITKSLKMRSQAYQNLGVCYIIAVVPNSHIVYSENLPDYFDNFTADTRLMQLNAYLQKNSDIIFLDLTDAIINNKSAGLLYNNTENSINSLGAYFVYQEIYNNIPKDLTKKLSISKFEKYDYCSHIVKGKSIAERVGLENYIKNNTISLSGKTLLKYKNNPGVYEYTLINEIYQNQKSFRPSIMVESPDDWNKIQLMPYFSNTFQMVTYKSSYTFNKQIIDDQGIDCVIQIINEDELLSLLDENITMSYNSVLKPSENLFITATPSIISRATTATDTVSIIGITEIDSTIYVIENGVTTKKVDTIDGRFIISFDLENIQQKTIYIFASSANKNSSNTIQVNLVKNQMQNISDAVVGKNSQLYSTIEPNNTFTSERIANLKNNIINSSEKFHQENERYPSFYCFPIPEKERILNDDLPNSLNSKYRALVNSNVNLNGLACKQVTMLEISDEFASLKKEEDLFMHTYSSLSDIGAFYCYRHIVLGLNLVKEDDYFLDLDFYNREIAYVESGELISELGFDEYLISEKAIKLKPKFELRASFTGINENVFNISRSFISEVDNNSLPVAVIIRDDNSADKVLPFLAEHFSKMIVLDPGVSIYSITKPLKNNIKPLKNTTKYDIIRIWKMKKKLI